MPANGRIRPRGDTAANWTATNPVLAERELGMDLTARNFRVGDGVTPWNTLPTWPASSGGVSDGDKGDVTVASSGTAWTLDTFRLDVTVAAATWTVNHNLNRRVSVETFTTGGTQFMAELVRVSDNQVRIELDTPMTGFVLVS